MSDKKLFRRWHLNIGSEATQSKTCENNNNEDIINPNLKNKYVCRIISLNLLSCLFDLMFFLCIYKCGLLIYPPHIVRVFSKRQVLFVIRFHCIKHKNLIPKICFSYRQMFCQIILIDSKYIYIYTARY